MAGLLVNYVQQYVRHIADGSMPKAEYVEHFEARSPRALGGQHILSGGQPHSPAFAKIEAHLSTEIENSMPYMGLEVQQVVEDMVEGVVCADKHMDMVSNRELGVDVHDVVGDGDCLLTTTCLMAVFLRTWHLRRWHRQPSTHTLRHAPTTRCAARQLLAEIQRSLNFTSPYKLHSSEDP